MILHPRVAAVQAEPGFKLRLTFRDGSAGTVDVARLVGEFSGILAPLGQPEYFARVTVQHEAGTVVWPNGVDLDPDVLYAVAHSLADTTARG